MGILRQEITERRETISLSPTIDNESMKVL